MLLYNEFGGTYPVTAKLIFINEHIRKGQIT